MSSSQYITLSSSVPIYNVLFDHFEKLIDEKSTEYCHIEEIRSAIRKGIDKLSSYYSKTDESELYYIATSWYFFFYNILNLFINQVFKPY